MSSRVYRPDRWVILELKKEGFGAFYKILAGWSGGYLDGDEYRVSSKIDKFSKEDNIIRFTNRSGSTYECNVDLEGFSSLTSSIYSQVSSDKSKKNYVAQIDFIDFEEKFKEDLEEEFQND
jgi:hypothetical protein